MDKDSLTKVLESMEDKDFFKFCELLKKDPDLYYCNRLKLYEELLPSQQFTFIGILHKILKTEDKYNETIQKISLIGGILFSGYFVEFTSSIISEQFRDHLLIIILSLFVVSISLFAITIFFNRKIKKIRDF